MIEVEGRQFRADREVVAVPGCPGANAPEHRGATGRQVHRFGHLAEWPPLVIAITPNGKTAYVTNGGSNTVTPINTATGKAIKVGRFPLSIAITPNGKTAYVANYGSGNGPSATVTPINTVTSKAGKAIRVGGYGAFPINIAITPNAKTAYVVITGDVFAAPGLVVPIQTATNKAGKPINVGKVTRHGLPQQSRRCGSWGTPSVRSPAGPAPDPRLLA